MPTFHKSDSPEWGVLIVGVALTDAGRLTPTVGSTLCWQSTQNGWLWHKKGDLPFFGCLPFPLAIHLG